MAQNFDLIVIGEGVSGLTCALEAARAGLRVATLESNLFGGLVLNVNELDGYPGAESGTELASGLMQSCAEAGITSVQEEVTSISTHGPAFDIVTRGGTHGARAVVIASGARLKKLGVPGEREFEGRGVSWCADCDAPMFQDEDVVVVGGGDSALQEALVLANFCRSVRVATRGDKLRARKHLADKAAANPKISILRQTTVDEIRGSKMVETIRLRSTADGKTEYIGAAGVFAYVGLEPNSGFAPQDMARDDGGHIMTDAALETTMRGIWAIGAVRAGYSGLLRDAAEEAKRAAAAVRERLD
jgi:thioredoxin reductase (NADPH)